MLKISFLVLLVFLFFYTVPQSEETIKIPPYFDETETKYINEAFAVLNMTADDLAFSKKPSMSEVWVENYKYTLRIVEHLMQYPLEFPGYADSLAKQISLEQNSLLNLLKTCSKELDIKITSENSTDKKIESLFKDKQSIEQFEKLPKKLKDVILQLLKAIDNGNELLQQAFKNLTKEERKAIFDGNPSAEIWGKADKNSLYEAGFIVFDVIDKTRVVLADFILDKSIDKPVILSFDSVIGPVIIGGTTSNEYNSNAAILIDLAGNDTYKGKVGASSETIPISICIDLEGDDRYEGKNVAQGAGILGIGVLIDEKGDDIYKGENSSQGSGIFGIGILADKKGNDYYQGDTNCQGSGMFGIGILIDGKGDDRYFACQYSQAFGFTCGIGALLDNAGNDLYFAGGKYPHVPLLPDRYRSLSQGFATGERYKAGGGIAILIDNDGSDTYQTDVFGQGVAYWLSLGMLVDRKGNDSYISTIYSQGAGIHLAAGLVLDEEGEDLYCAVHGVAQGCGHDYSVGMLIDRKGNDRYLGTGFSEGSADENSFAMLFDKQGKDFYAAQREDSQGSGKERYGSCSIGILIDLDGKEDKFTQRDSKENYVFNGELGLSSVLNVFETKEEVKGKELEITDNSLEGLFKVASLWQVGTNKNAVYEARKRLIERKNESLPFLLKKKLASSGIYEIRALKEIFKGLGEEAVEPLIAKISDSDERVKRNVVELLGIIGSEKAIDVLIERLSDKEAIVISSLESLSNLKAKKAVSSIIKFLDKKYSEFLRIQAIKTLGNIGDESAIEPLIKCLSNELITIRFAAAKAIVNIGASTMSRIEKLTKLMESEDWLVRGYTAKALGLTGEDKAIECLKSYQQKEKHPFVQSMIIQAIKSVNTAK